MDYMIKELVERDIPRSAEIIRSAFATVAVELGLTRENCPTNGAFIEEGVLNEDYCRGVSMYGLFLEDTQAGFVALEKKDASLFFLEKLAVLPEYRRRGFGRALIDHVVKMAREGGGKRLSIGIIYENKKLLRWYELYGFTRTGTRAFAHLPFTVCFMELCL